MNKRELFSSLCDTFESISTAKNKQERLQILRPFVESYKRKDFFDVLRLFLPHWERERGSYRIGESTFTRILINILCLPPTGSDVRLLRDFNKSSNTSGKIKDYADAAYNVVRKRSWRSTPTTIKEINEKLNEMAAGDIRRQEAILLELFQKISHLEIKWLIRILLKSVHIGLGKGDILAAYHPDAPKYFTANNSLKQLCLDLYDRSKSFSEVQISMFNAFRPMLSLRCDVKEFNRSISDGKEFMIEEKFDGERFQLHYSDGNFKYFSRNSFDFTEGFVDHAKEVKLKKGLNARNAILDGEMMVYYKNSKKFGSKGVYADIKKIKADLNIQQCFCVFDIVYLNGENLCKKDLRERKRLLQQVVTPIEGVLQVSSWSIGRSKQDILDALNKSLDAKEEGIVFKDPQSQYLPNERIGWWKLKLEYFEGVMSDLDVAIIGGYYGIGSNKGNITGFLVAARNDAGDFLSFAKISTGLNRTELRLLDEKLNMHWEDVPKNNEQENSGVFWGREIPHKWIKPEHSTCLLVRGSELIKIYGTNPEYRTQYTLRFPRILSLRLDKSCSECLTTKDLQTLTESSGVVAKLNKRHLELSDLVLKTKPKRRKYDGFGLPEIEIQSNILHPYKFQVLSGLGKWTKQEVENAIRENGGIAMVESTQDTYCMLVGDPHLRTRTYKGNVDIVKIDWLRRVLNDGELIPYEPLDVIYMSEKSRRKFLKEYDKFGDSYTQPATKESINRILNEKFYKDENSNGAVLNLTVGEVDEFLNEIKFDEWKSLRGCIAYFDLFKIVNDPLSKELACLDFMQQVDFKMQGGTISKFLTTDCHCVIAAQSRLEEVETYLKNIHHKIPIFTSIQEFIMHRKQALPSRST